MMTQNAPILPIGNVSLYRGNWWLGRELNPRRRDFQSLALPTELPSRAIAEPSADSGTRSRVFQGARSGVWTGGRDPLQPGESLTG